MPIQLEIFHPDRIVVGVARGNIRLEEYAKFIADVIEAGVMHYRKIIDVTSADSTTVGKDELMSFEARLREFAQKRPRGALAIVADASRGDLARTFKELTSADRPIEVFRSIHDARKWLASHPFDG